MFGKERLYLIAINVAKLFHLKITSQCENPHPVAILIFSDSVYGINTFSKASRFCIISYCE